MKLITIKRYVGPIIKALGWAHLKERYSIRKMLVTIRPTILIEGHSGRSQLLEVNAGTHMQRILEQRKLIGKDKPKR